MYDELLMLLLFKLSGRGLICMSACVMYVWVGGCYLSGHWSQDHSSRPLSKTLTDAPLQTQQQRDTGKGWGYVTTVIRVMLPDHWVLQGTFNSGESCDSHVTQ